ncbi:hypothetical protein EC988_003813, partial [Linderina pennispora]
MASEGNTSNGDIPIGIDIASPEQIATAALAPSGDVATTQKRPADDGSTDIDMGSSQPPQQPAAPVETKPNGHTAAASDMDVDQDSLEPAAKRVRVESPKPEDAAGLVSPPENRESAAPVASEPVPAKTEAPVPVAVAAPAPDAVAAPAPAPASASTPAPAPAPAPAQLHRTEILMTKEQHKYCTAMLRALKKHRDAGPFLKPVDVVALNIPDYVNIIKYPMDLSTIEDKLKGRVYADTQGFTDDLRLMFNNAYIYNGRESVVGNMAGNLEAMFDTQIKKMPTGLDTALAEHNRHSSDTSGGRRSSSVSRPKREAHPPPSRDVPSSGRKKSMPSDPQLRFCLNVVKDFMKKSNFNIAYPFLEPVDPVAMNCPDYFDIIKQPMDLTTMKKKLERGAYQNALDFDSDMRLMFRNCYTYNPPGHPVHEAGRALEARFDQKWTELPVASSARASQSPAPHSSAGAPPPLPPSFSVSGGTAIAHSQSFSRSHSPPVGGEDEFDKHVYTLDDEIDIDARSQSSQTDEIRSLELKVQSMARQLEELKRSEGTKRRPSYGGVGGGTPRRPSVGSARSATRSPPPPLSAPPTSMSHRRVGSNATSPISSTAPMGVAGSGRGRGTPGRRRGSRGRGARGAAAGMTREEFAGMEDALYSAPPTGGSGRGRGRRRRGSIESLELTLDQKRALSGRIEELDPNRLRVALMIIKSAYPDLNEDEEEIELDIDTLDHFTLRKLYEYVVLSREEAAREAIQRNNAQHAERRAGNNGTSSSSQSALAAPVQPSAHPRPDEAVQRRINQLDEKLKRLDSTRQYDRSGSGRAKGMGFDSSSSGESGSSDSEDS